MIPRIYMLNSVQLALMLCLCNLWRFLPLKQSLMETIQRYFIDIKLSIDLSLFGL
jgi:hypothetical protein